MLHTLADATPWAKSGPLPSSENKVLWGHSHTHPLAQYLYGSFWAVTESVPSDRYLSVHKTESSVRPFLENTETLTLM